MFCRFTYHLYKHTQTGAFCISCGYNMHARTRAMCGGMKGDGAAENARYVYNIT